MKHKIALFFLFLPLSLASFAQNVPPKEKMTREEKDEKNKAREARINTKNDYVLFRKQIIALKEYNDEKKKVPKLQADNKMTLVKVVIAIDSVDEGDTTKILTGYIVQNIGDNATLLYDITYDRALKKIVSLKRTQEAIDADKEEKEDKAKDKKPGAKPVVHKKNKDDDDDDEPEEKPSKTKEKDED